LGIIFEKNESKPKIGCRGGALTQVGKTDSGGSIKAAVSKARLAGPARVAEDYHPQSQRKRDEPATTRLGETLKGIA